MIRNLDLIERFHLNHLQQADYLPHDLPARPWWGLLVSILGSLLGWCIIFGIVYAVMVFIVSSVML